jgi:hypothetical protein
MVEPSRAVAWIGGAGWSTRASWTAEPQAATSRTRANGRTNRRMGRCLGGTPSGYWAVAVPVMFGWTAQTKVYCPAGIEGTS